MNKVDMHFNKIKSTTPVIERRLVFVDLNNKAYMILKDINADVSTALPLLIEAREIIVELVRRNPENIQYQQDLFNSHIRIGDIEQLLGDLDAALSAYQSSLIMVKMLESKDLNNSELHRSLADTYSKIGDIEIKSGKTASALIAYQADLVVLKKLMIYDSLNSEWQKKISNLQNKIGAIELDIGNVANALIAYKASRDIGEILVAQNPDNKLYRLELIMSYSILFNIYSDQGQSKKALSCIKKLREQYLEMKNNNQLSQDEEQNIVMANTIILNMKK